MPQEKTEDTAAQQGAPGFRFSRTRAMRIGAVICCIALNVAPALAAERFGLPLYLDTVGTLTAVWAIGPMTAILTAVASGILLAPFSRMSVYFVAVNICIALGASRMLRMKMIKRRGGVLLLIFALGLLGGALGAPIAWSMRNAVSTHFSVAPIAERITGLSESDSFPVLLLINLLLNLADKSVTVAAALLLHRLLPPRVREAAQLERLAEDPDSLDPESLHRRLLAVFAAEAVALVALCAWTSVAIYSENARAEGVATAQGAARQAVAAVDPQLVGVWLEQGKAAQGYEETWSVLQGIRDNTPSLEYVYVYQIREDGCHVVFDNVPEGEETSAPGDVLPFDSSFLPLLPTLLSGGEIEPLESDDTFGWLLTVYQPIYDGDGRCVAYAGADVSMHRLLGFVRDFLMRVVLIASGFLILSLAVGERTIGSYHRIINRQYGQIREAKEDAEYANQAKSRFLANMSHEIRTPINAVLGMDEMILRESTEPAIRGYAADIRTAGNTLLAIINDILDSSKIESGRMELVPVEYELAGMVRELCNMILQRAQAKDLAFITEVDESLPCRLYGDDVRVRQIITNILTNAVKYTPSGAVTLRVGGKRDKGELVLHVEVEDTGIGIREEDIPKLFEAFQRIEESRNRSIEGTGLGMNITVQLLAMMDSRLEVESVYGKGSRFFFDLRQKIVDETPIGAFSALDRPEGEGGRYEGSFIAPDARVLVVDDNAMNLKVFRSLLKATQVQVTEADSGKAALSLAEADHFDMVFMDHMMPGMDGVETMHRMRALEGYDQTPVYILTANAVAGAKEQYLSEGFDGFVAKPIVTEKLEQALREALPEALLKPYEALPGETQTASTPPEDLPPVDGLDWAYAWLHLPERTLLESTVREFREVLPLQADRLERMWADIQNGAPEARSAYRIQVHGMKSAAATVGIVPLAGMAKLLEFAARDGDIRTMERLHDVFVEEWRSYGKKLGELFPEQKSSEPGEREDADAGMLRALLGVLRTAMEELDVDTADEVVGKLRSYRLTPELEALLPALSAAVAGLDEDEAARVTEQMETLLEA